MPLIFVTGGTGLLGNCIVRELCKRGMKVRALCRKGTARACFDGLEIEIVEGDLSDSDLLDRNIEGCSAVIHSAAMIHIGWQKLDAAREVNVEGTRRIVDACVKQGARLVYVSTVDTLPAAVGLELPINETGTDSASRPGIEKTACTYVVSKREAEDVVWQEQRKPDSKLDAVVLHPGFMLSPNDWKPSSGRMMLEVHKAPVLAAPQGGCSLCDARDVAGATVNAIELGKSGENYILAGENLPYQELWSLMIKTMGRKKRVFKMGPLVRIGGKVIDAAIKLFRIREGDINGAAIAMGNLNHYYDSSKAKKELKYLLRPKEQTLGDAWEWLKAHHLNA